MPQLAGNMEGIVDKEISSFSSICIGSLNKADLKSQECVLRHGDLLLDRICMQDKKIVSLLAALKFPSWESISNVPRAISQKKEESLTLREVESVSSIDMETMVHILDDCESKQGAFQRSMDLKLEFVCRALEEGLTQCKECSEDLSMWKEQQGFYTTPWLKLHNRGLREWTGELHKLRIQ